MIETIWEVSGMKSTPANVVDCSGKKVMFEETLTPEIGYVQSGVTVLSAACIESMPKRPVSDRELAER